jgi:predicted NUDIX family phosphoesterase
MRYAACGSRLAVRGLWFADCSRESPLSHNAFKPYINDDTILVGRAHIGLLYNIHLSNKEVYINETDKMIANWIDKSDLAEFYEVMETWPKIAFDFYIK